jgi:XTP/dITP diphosphohydrolase
MRNLRGQTLCIATHNQGKLDEIAALLGPYGCTAVSAGKLGLPEPVEDGTTFVANARIKAHAAARACGLPALADDSGLCVDALDGAPGVLTADWAAAPGGRDFVRAMTRLWQVLEAAGAPEPRLAQFRCTLVVAWPDGADAVFEGAMPGRITWPMRGSQGHGFDPVFQPDGFAITFGEMDRWEKNRISHRARAFDQLVAGCFT